MSLPIWAWILGGLLLALLGMVALGAWLTSRAVQDWDDEA